MCLPFKTGNLVDLPEDSVDIIMGGEISCSKKTADRVQKIRQVFDAKSPS